MMSMGGGGGRGSQQLDSWLADSVAQSKEVYKKALKGKLLIMDAEPQEEHIETVSADVIHKQRLLHYS